MSLTIRPATADDAPLIQPLLHAAHRWNCAAGFNFSAATVDIPEIQERLEEAEVYLMLADGAAVGTVTIFADGTIGWLGVAPEAQGAGHGRRLLTFAEARIREMGLTRAKLDTPVNHPWLPAFYQRCGYVPVGTTHWEGKRYDSVLLEKELPEPWPPAAAALHGAHAPAHGPAADAAPLSHPAVSQLLNALLAGARSALGAQFVGFYLHGSLALGDFDPSRSDIDFLVVTGDDLSPEATESLAAMHRRITTSDLAWRTNFEGSYIPQAALRHYDPAHATHPAIECDGTFHVVRHGVDWTIQRHVIREYGVALAGPPPHTLIDPVSADDLRRATRQLLQDWWVPMLADPIRMQHNSEYQAYAVLTMCRALYTLRTGAVAPKPVAVAWARPELGPDWHSLIDEALAWRRGVTFDHLDDVLNLIRHVSRN